MPHALIIDDDASACAALAELVADEGFTTSSAGSLAEARERLRNAPDVILLDLVLPDGNGIELMRDLPRGSTTEVIVVTGHATLESSIEAIRRGATDYLLKPINLAHLRGVLSRVARPTELRAEVTGLRNELRSLGRFGRLVGGSPPMQRLYDELERVAPTGATVFITGESGTGKEVVAQTIHEVSRRRLQPFLAVNCGAISPQLIESELFGHEKGSFTGANRQHRGFFERAHGGTLFLDEVTEMPSDLQVKLLRVLETRTVSRVGSDQPLETDVRVLAASNRNPHEAVNAGKLRRDLLYRLQVFPLYVPPLRERIEDIELLAEHFLAELNKGARTPKAFTPGRDRAPQALQLARQRARAVERRAARVHHERRRVDHAGGSVRRADAQRGAHRPLVPGQRRRSHRRGREAPDPRDGAAHADQGSRRRDPRHQRQDALQPSARLRIPRDRSRGVGG
jgi:DNA-binding NtrC family response regulator